MSAARAAPGAPRATPSPAATAAASDTSTLPTASSTPSAVTPEALGHPTPADSAVTDTPALLARWRLVGVATTLLFGIATALLLGWEWDANRAGAATTEQVLRVQSIESELLRADALATNAFLVGGLEPTEQRADYDTALDQVARLVADAADAQPADRQALGALNTAVLSYAADAEQARATNRQGLPVGAQYLREASATLRSDAVPVIDALVRANTQRAEAEMGVHRFWLVAVPTLAAIGVLIWVNLLLARAFHRRLNVGIVVAIAIVITLGGSAVALAFGANREVAELRAGAYADAVDASAARALGNDAKANEALRLVARGSGAAFETAWADAAAGVAQRLDSLGDEQAVSTWRSYAQRHAQIVALDDGGAWDQAVAAATSTAAPAATTDFDAFDETVATLAEQAGVETTQALRSGNGLIGAAAVASLVGGVLAAAAVAAGIGQRRQEFA